MTIEGPTGASLDVPFPSEPELMTRPAPQDESELEDVLSSPSPGVIDAMAGLEGDLLVLGAGGKMGLSIASMAQRALRASGSSSRVTAVSRFGNGTADFDAMGIETISRDLLDDGAFETLPDAANILYLAGMKFGSSGAQPTTWAMNVHLPGLAARRYRGSRIVALSTGNVYAFAPVGNGGSYEDEPPSPVGEYAITCLGRERLFTWFSERDGTPVALIRLNYANALRYGVLVDIALRVLHREPIDVAMGTVNIIWQGDANAAILRAFTLCASPPAILNVAGPETLSVRWIAHRFAEILGVGAPVIVGEEAASALLSNSTRLTGLFGYPSLPVQRLITWTAEWISSGRPLLGKPTGFQTRDGTF